MPYVAIYGCYGSDATCHPYTEHWIALICPLTGQQVNTVTTTDVHRQFQGSHHLVPYIHDYIYTLFTISIVLAIGACLQLMCATHYISVMLHCYLKTKLFPVGHLCNNNFWPKNYCSACMLFCVQKQPAPVAVMKRVHRQVRVY